MTYYIQFKDEEEYVICGSDEEFARELATDQQKQRNGSIEIIECKWVADK